MWKYFNSREFLLSLNLVDGTEDNKIIKEIYAISNNVENNYRVFKIRKRNGKYRTICEPNTILKHIQRQILDNILNDVEISEYAKAYKKGISLRENTLVHTNKKLVLKLDIEDFFDNISFANIYNKCFGLSKYPKHIGVLLTTLVTYNGYLPQGAPTSSYISNIVMRDFDNAIGDWCKINNVSYTRYSDDMTFSGDFIPGEIVKLVRKNLYKLGLKINNDKIHVVKRSSSQNVTGIVVNEKIQVSRKYRDKIRQEVYYIKKYGIDSHIKTINELDKEKYLNSLLGRILYVLQINNEDKEFIEYKNYIRGL